MDGFRDFVIALFHYRLVTDCGFTNARSRRQHQAETSAVTRGRNQGF